MIQSVEAGRYAALNAYKTGGFKQVQGWCLEKMFDVVEHVDRFQEKLGISGGAIEIGVHHGKFFLLMNQLVDKAQQSYAVDVFENQHLNIDNSGKGSLAAFKENLQKYDLHSGENVTVINHDSTAPGLRDLLPRGKLRLFSIDGGHTVEHTINDLELAADVLHEAGVVFLDDIGNVQWPGVFEGVLKYLGRRPTLVPFAIGINKLLMTRLSYRAAYLEHFSTSPLVRKKVELSGFSMVALA